MQVGLEPVAGREARDLAVRVVDDHVLAARERVLLERLPPRQHRLALPQRDAEVHRRLRRGRVEPDDLAGGVEDHHPALAGARRRREEEVARRRPRRGVRTSIDRRPQVRARVEVLDGRAPPDGRLDGRALESRNRYAANAGPAGEPEPDRAAAGATEELGARPLPVAGFTRSPSRPATPQTDPSARRVRECARRRSGSRQGGAPRALGGDAEDEQDRCGELEPRRDVRGSRRGCRRSSRGACRCCRGCSRSSRCRPGRRSRGRAARTVPGSGGTGIDPQDPGALRHLAVGRPERDAVDADARRLGERGRRRPASACRGSAPRRTRARSRPAGASRARAARRPRRASGPRASPPPRRRRREPSASGVRTSSALATAARSVVGASIT